MSTPSDPGARPDGAGTDSNPHGGDEPGTGASSTGDEQPFDPYRFGKPDRPIPREYWPPGYTPDPEPEPAPPGAAPYPPPQAYPYGTAPYGQPGAHGQSGPPGPYPGYPPASGQPYGTPYGPPGGHAQPPAPHGYGYGPSRPSTTKAVLSLVFGIASIVLCWLSIFDAVAIVPAIVLGIIALNDAGRKGGAGKGMAIAGIVCAVAGAVLAVTATILFQNAVDKCGGPAGRDDPGFNKCIQDNIF